MAGRIGVGVIMTVADKVVVLRRSRHEVFGRVTGEADVVTCGEGKESL
jgi:hypothetical protein